jgi:hypothetical protein
MAFSPNSKVYLLDTPLDNNYKNEIRFTSLQAQYNYFAGRIRHTFNDVTYQRKDNIVRVAKHIDELWNVNYVMYQNSNFTNKWFYAFITKMVYVNDRTTEIYIETDVYQTWLFDAEIKESFVVREHVKDDTIGKNLIEEQLDTGEYKMYTYERSGKLGDLWNVIAFSDISVIPPPLGSTEPTGNIYANVVSGLTYFAFPNTHDGTVWLKNVIEAYTTAGKVDAIVMIFTIPYLALGTDETLPHKIANQQLFGYDTISIAKKLDNIDGYVPKNNKLFCYPYNFLYVSNNGGQSAQYRYEDFIEENAMFTIWGSIMPNTTLMFAPNKYKGDGNTIKYEYGLTLNGFPLASWVSDTYTAWLAQNSGATAVGLIASAGAGIIGGVTGNAMAVMGGVMGIYTQLHQWYKASIQPDEAKGQVGSGSLHIASNSLDFYISHMGIKAEFAKRIDDFLTMFGYKVNALKIPELNSRLRWNYVQTIDINIDGSIPTDDMTRLKKIYNDGVTLWHNPTEFLNYDLSNPII